MNNRPAQQEPEPARTVGGNASSDRKTEVDEFRVAIGVAPTLGNASVELRMVKAAMLFASHIDLHSPMSVILSATDRLKEMTDAEVALLAQRLIEDNGIGASEGLEPAQTQQLFELATGPRPKGFTRKAVRLRKLQRSFGKLNLGRDLRGKASEIANNTIGFRDIERVASAGVLTIVGANAELELVELIADLYAESGGIQRDGADHRIATIGDFGATLLLDAIAQRGRYPLLDTKTGTLADAAAAVGLGSASAVARSRVAGFGNTLLAHLPSPKGKVDELLDLRRELHPYVSRFRRGLATASEGIDGAQWSPEFEQQAQEIYLVNVAPHVEELRDKLRSTRAFHGFFENIVGAAGDMGKAAGIGLVVANLADPDLPKAVLASIGVGAVVAKEAMSQIKEKRLKRETLRNNDWFLLYQADRTLRGS